MAKGRQGRGDRPPSEYGYLGIAPPKSNVASTAFTNVDIDATTGPSTMRPHSRFSPFERFKRLAEPTYASLRSARTILEWKVSSVSPSP